MQKLYETWGAVSKKGRISLLPAFQETGSFAPAAQAPRAHQSDTSRLVTKLRLVPRRSLKAGSMDILREGGRRGGIMN